MIYYIDDSLMIHWWFITLMIHWWLIDDSLMIYWWFIDDLLHWWFIDDWLMIHWWFIDDSLMIYWWFIDNLLHWWFIDDLLMIHWWFITLMIHWWLIDDSLMIYWWFIGVLLMIDIDHNSPEFFSFAVDPMRIPQLGKEQILILFSPRERRCDVSRPRLVRQTKVDLPTDAHTEGGSLGRKPRRFLRRSRRRLIYRSSAEAASPEKLEMFGILNW